MPVDKINPAAAASAYANIQKSGSGSGISGGDDTSSFSNMVRKAAVDSLETLHAGEKASALAVTGKADLTDVVEAVSSAELTLQTVVALRDRLLGAYQEIMRMPI
jgi:flagellar hook-basal body complex protein FliE